MLNTLAERVSSIISADIAFCSHTSFDEFMLNLHRTFTGLLPNTTSTSLSYNCGGIRRPNFLSHLEGDKGEVYK